MEAIIHYQRGFRRDRASLFPARGTLSRAAQASDTIRPRHPCPATSQQIPKSTLFHLCDCLFMLSFWRLDLFLSSRFYRWTFGFQPVLLLFHSSLPFGCCGCLPVAGCVCSHPFRVFSRQARDIAWFASRLQVSELCCPILFPCRPAMG
jgi:hypothetical protein